MCCAPGEGADTAKNRLPHHPATPVPPDEKTHPMQVSLLGAEAIVKVTNAPTNLIQQARGAQDRRAGFHGNFIPVFLHSASIKNPSCKSLTGEISVQNIPYGPVYPAGFAGYIT